MSDYFSKIPFVVPVIAFSSFSTLFEIFFIIKVILLFVVQLVENSIAPIFQYNFSFIKQK
jgi:hypothetical protein